MKDGLYLSTYLTPPGVSWLLGIWPRHDNNMSLWRKAGNDIRLLRHWELERYSGLRQHGAAFATVGEAFGFIDELLKAEGVGRSDIEEIWGTPGIETSRDHGYQDTGLPWHGISHLFSSMLLDPDRFYTGKTLALAVDGVPDFMVDHSDHFYAGAVVVAGNCRFFPIESPGRIYDSARERFGLQAGTLMALATASSARAEVDPAECLQGLQFWGSARICPEGLGAVAAGDILYERVTQRVRAWLREAPGEVLDDRFSAQENFVSMVMKILQSACLLVMERTIESAFRRFDLQPQSCQLSISGGFGLNLPSNTHLFQKYGFEGFVAPPFTNDSGQSIGLALATFHRRMKDCRLKFRFSGAYLGAPATNEQIDRVFVEYADWIESVDDWCSVRFAQDIEESPLVWFDGGSESGPRALGHRSLLADPRLEKNKQLLNNIKQRQWWRPVAPIVLEESLEDWFEDPVRSSYMLHAFRIRATREKMVPVILHLDGSARVQSLRRPENPRLYEGMAEFAARSGVPMLANTSLNDKGEPIVNLPSEALHFAIRKGIGIAYICGRRVVLRARQTSSGFERPLARQGGQFQLATFDRHAEVSGKVNPWDVPPVELYYYIERPELARMVQLTEPTAPEMLRGVLERDPKRGEEIERYLARVWQLYRPPCQDFARHRWAGHLRYPIDEVKYSRPF